MDHHYILCPLLLILHMFCCCQGTTAANQSQFFTLMRTSLSGNLLSNWDVSKDQNFCNYQGVGCNNQGYVEKIDISGWSLSGQFPEDVCSYLPELRILRLGHNNLHGSFPSSITNCSLLEELEMSSAYLTGSLPDLSPLNSMRSLDLSYNYFQGNFPVSFTNLTNLEMLNFNENDGFNFWQLPENISRLTKLQTVILTTCKLHGRIPASIGSMTSLTDLELSGNYLVGKLPSELGQLKNLKQLELYYNELEGEIPEEFGNLTALVDLDMSVNKFTKVPEALWRLPNLASLQLYNNSLTGEIPAFLGNSTTLTLLSLYENYLTEKVPENLGRFSPLVGVDLSENQLSGELPAYVCNGGKLLYFLFLDNKFSGEIPESYAKCNFLLRFRVNHNQLEGRIPEGLLGLPHVSIIDISNNHLNGSISKTIEGAKNLSELFMQNNRLSGILPVEISRVINLVKIDLSDNLLSGSLPPEIGNLKQLNLLLLQGNKFNSSIPESLSLLKSLNVLDLSSNLFTGNIPQSLSQLLPNSMNFSNNMLSGPIPPPFVEGSGLLESFSQNPGLCVPNHLNASRRGFPLCSPAYNRRKVKHIWVIGISVGIVIVGIVLFLKRWFHNDRAMMEHEDTLSSSFFSFDVKSFHRVSFDQREIIESMIDKNIVGYGGSGTVYKIELSNGEVVAVKKLWSRKAKDYVSDDQLVLDKELKTEVETLGSIRHKNIVKLYSYFSSLDCSLLVYEYMPNGNLWEALHGEKIILNWPPRYQIALGVAQGLAYLHHDLLPPIIHRDIKSTNILLDINYQPKVADFGIAKVLQARGGKDSTTTVIAGTYGYLAPEYAYSSKATTKCDVYSFGVVLMELITGKKPVEADLFGENKDIIYWVSTKVETKEGPLEVLDKKISGSFKDEMIKMLRVAIRCTCRNPALRPTMNEVVQLLIEADPCKFGSCKSLNKTKETFNITKPKNISDL
ncbi:receptor protein-tyrosine kinase CEPR1-like [Coffea eugenioides]|uniref:receptor protein-tyrosine kinase CEPR1-like n=1 Tax=Coffea eugenioides TaxID=49369 RepID=UPI000F60DF76|nr:receptor protein-tyrosine kinase CEPR1-like [Coffea eugenioides]